MFGRAWLEGPCRGGGGYREAENLSHSLLGPASSILKDMSRGDFRQLMSVRQAIGTRLTQNVKKMATWVSALGVTMNYLLTNQ